MTILLYIITGYRKNIIKKDHTTFYLLHETELCPFCSSPGMYVCMCACVWVRACVCNLASWLVLTLLLRE